MENDRYPFVNLPLPYAFDALEPWIDEKTMMLHHDRHLQTYIDRLNAALKDAPRLQRLTLEQLLCKAPRLPEPTKTALLQNAGGVYNHRFYFALLQPRQTQRRPVRWRRRSTAISAGSMRFARRFRKRRSACSAPAMRGWCWTAAS